MDDNKKFFDVNKPHQVSADPASRPVIVGHHPTIPDPMLKDVREKAPKPISVTVNDEPSTPLTPKLSDISSPAETSPAFTPSAAALPVSEDGSITPAAQSSSAAQSGVVADVQPLPPTAKAPAPPEPPAGMGAELHVPAGQAVYHHKPRLWVWLVLAVIILASVYAALDAKTTWMPFHIFSHNKSTPPSSQSNSSTGSSSSQSSQPTIPAGFTLYQPAGTPLEFAYPVAWGTPTTTTDPGFSQRGTGKKTDGVHAYLVDFATNKKVEIAVTSSKYLPASRTPLYYDYLQWCIGPTDNKIYKQLLHFATTAGIDTPGTTTCDQGPLTDASEINSAIIVQLKTKDASGTVLGDIYTANLSDTSLPVLRIKDSAMTNGTEIKQLLNTVSGAPSSSQ